MTRYMETSRGQSNRDVKFAKIARFSKSDTSKTHGRKLANSTDSYATAQRFARAVG